MKRTQLYLDEKMWRDISVLSKQKKKSISELVRIAIHKTYGLKRDKDSTAVLSKAFGIWKNRKDLKDTEAYIRNIRKGRRIDQLRES